MSSFLTCPIISIETLWRKVCNHIATPFIKRRGRAVLPPMPIEVKKKTMSWHIWRNRKSPAIHFQPQNHDLDLLGWIFQSLHHRMPWDAPSAGRGFDGWNILKWQFRQSEMDFPWTSLAYGWGSSKGPWWRLQVQSKSLQRAMQCSFDCGPGHLAISGSGFYTVDAEVDMLLHPSQLGEDVFSI